MHSQRVPHQHQSDSWQLQWAQGLFQKTKDFARAKNDIFFLQRPKLKQDIFAGTIVIFKPVKKYCVLV